MNAAANTSPAPYLAPRDSVSTLRVGADVRAEVRRCYVSMQKEMGGMRAWARLSACEVADLARVLIHNFTELDYSEHLSYLKELKEVGPNADMESWATIKPISPQTRWYVEIVIPNAD